MNTHKTKIFILTKGPEEKKEVVFMLERTLLHQGPRSPSSKHTSKSQNSRTHARKRQGFQNGISDVEENKKKP